LLELHTPNGNPVSFEVRDGTNDHNVIYSICAADEYELRGVTNLEGWALDLGAHIGGVALCLAVDNPGLVKVVAVEPVPMNAQLIRQAVARCAQNLYAGVRVLENAVGAPGTTTTIRFGFRDAAGNVDHHGWVGNASMVYEAAPVEAHDALEVTCVDLLALKTQLGGPPAFVKVDCEGGEWPALEQIVALDSPRVIGEWHPVLGHESNAALVEAFESAGYTVATSGPAGGPGLFLATK
jgi:FkbM family methyltransferase